MLAHQYAWDARATTQQFAAPDFDSSKPGQLNFSDFLNLFVFNSKEGFGAVVLASGTPFTADRVKRYAFAKHGSQFVAYLQEPATRASPSPVEIEGMRSQSKSSSSSVTTAPPYDPPR